MAQRKRTVKVDKATAERMHAQAKEAKMDEAADMPIPNDGIDHSRWPAEARKLALLLVSPDWLTSSQEQRAVECGYSLRSVQRYESDPEFKAYVGAIADKAYGHLWPLFVAGMEAGLRSGNPKFFEMYGKSRSLFKEVRQVTSDVNIKDERVSDDLDAELDRLESDVGVRRVVN